MGIIDIVRRRRTQYALSDRLPLPPNEIVDLVKDVVREAPSSYNSQSSRVVFLFGDDHRRFWTQLVMEVLRPLTSPEQLPTTEEKMASFAAGAGTLLFFEDQDVIADLQTRFPLYADKFPLFSAHSTGMAQFAVWTALAHYGIGASLQHYNPVIDEAVRDTWKLPASWQLHAQMPFGGHAGAIGDKTYIDDTIRFRSFG